MEGFIVDVTGTWIGTIFTEGTPETYALVLEQDGTSIQGTGTGEDEISWLYIGSISSSNQMTLVSETVGNIRTLNVYVSVNRMTGTYSDNANTSVTARFTRL